MKKIMRAEFVATFFIVLACGVGIVSAAGEKTADDVFNFNLKEATVLGAMVVAEGPQSLELQGTNTNNWGSVIFPDNGVKDMEVKGTFNIAQPGKWYSWTYKRYFPLQFHYATEQPGYDFGIMVRRQNSGVFYRILFSTKWNEVALWKEGEPGVDPEAPPVPSGLFAVVKKQELKQGQAYAFTVKVIGNRLQVMLDGKTVLEYEDKTLPLESGGWGFGIFNGATVKVSGLELRKASGELKIAAKTRPHFRVEKWHGADVVFDGDEPIARTTQGTQAWMNDVKVKPGYHAQIAWPYVFAHLVEQETTMGAKTKFESIRCLDDKVVEVKYGTSDEYADDKGTMLISYNPDRDTYCYDVDQTAVIKKDNDKYLQKNRYIYFANIQYYNAMPTVDESLKKDHTSLYTASSPYRMALVKGADGTPCRWPIHHHALYEPWSKNKGKLAEDGWDLAKDMYFVRYPEPVVCPTVEIVPWGDDCAPALIHCCAYWDMHFMYTPLKDGTPVTQLKAGDSYRARYRILGYPRAEADKLTAKSKLAPFLDPTIECPQYVPGMNSFVKGGNVEQTAGREIWQCNNNSVTWDKTVGRNDTFSLRFVNNAVINGDLFGYNDEGFAADEWEFSVWVKTDAWEGSGIRIGAQIGGKPCEWGEYFPMISGEWKKVVYTSQNPIGGNIYLKVETKGKGTCWVDDVEFKKLKLPGDGKKMISPEAVKIGKRKGAIMVDGVLDEADWKTAMSAPVFINGKGKEPARNQTLAKMLYDDDYVYFGIECMEPAPEKLLAQYTKRDDAVWKDDDIEMFIDPEGTGSMYYHFAINPKGCIYDAAGSDTSWNADCETACKVLPDRWVLEMKVKASSLNAKTGQGEKWKIHMDRARRPEGGEASSWSVDGGGGFNHAERFRPVVFEKP